MPDTTPHPFPAEWGWYFSFDGGEFYQGGPFASREEAIDEAARDGAGKYQHQDLSWWESFEIAECLPNHIDLARYFHADEWLEHLLDAHMDLGPDGPSEDGDHPLDDLKPEQLAALHNAVRTAIRQWQKDQHLPLRTFYFKETRNRETIDRPATRATGGSADD